MATPASPTRATPSDSRIEGRSEAWSNCPSAPVEALLAGSDVSVHAGKISNKTKAAVSLRAPFASLMFLPSGSNRNLCHPKESYLSACPRRS
jgi:hypothetical protein